MFIYEVKTCYNEDTLIVTEDLVKAIDQEILDQTGSNLKINIWENGKIIFESKLYDKDEHEINYDSIYVDIMKFIANNKEVNKNNE